MPPPKNALKPKSGSLPSPLLKLAPRLKQYFQQRGYRLHTVNADGSEVTFQGNVAASPFLAAFLFGLAVCGATAIALVLTVLLPERGILAFWSHWFDPHCPLVLLAGRPAAGNR